jgi:hypothetical protein
MSNDRINSALEQLKAERASVGERMSALQREMQDTAAQLQRLDGAIAALDADAHLMAEFKMGQPPAVGGDLDVPRLRHDIPRGSEDRILPFVTRGVGKERDGLHSAKMVAAVADALATPVSREKLKAAFFEYFDRDRLGKYWDDPDKAFRSAFRRAVERDMVLPVEYPNGQTVYTGGFREVTADRPRRVEPIGKADA